MNIDAIVDARTAQAIARFSNHRRRPVNRRDPKAASRQTFVVRSGTAAEIEHVRTGTCMLLEETERPLAHVAQRPIARVRTVVGRRHAIERATGLEKRFLGHAHGAFLHPAFNEHTHRWQIGLVPTVSDWRNKGRFRLTIVSSGRSRMLPIGSWKKHGRTRPSASMTADTHGALHLTGGKSPSPSIAA